MIAVPAATAAGTSAAAAASSAAGRHRSEQRQAPQERDLAEWDRYGRFTPRDRPQRCDGDHRQQQTGNRDRADAHAEGGDQDSGRQGTDRGTGHRGPLRDPEHDGKPVRRDEALEHGPHGDVDDCQTHAGSDQERQRPSGTGHHGEGDDRHRPCEGPDHRQRRQARPPDDHQQAAAPPTIQPSPMAADR